MTTALQIVSGALSKLGVLEAGQTVDSDDAQLALDSLNGLVDSWATQRLYAYATALVSAEFAGEALTIGTGMDFACARPLRLEPGCFVRVGDNDYPLEILTRAEYSAISQKELDGPWPSACFYDNTSPTGTVYFWPLGACTVFLVIQTRLSEFAALATDYTLTPGTKRALIYSLAEEIAPDFGAKVSAQVIRTGANARRALRRANVSIPNLDTQRPMYGVSPSLASGSGSFDGGSA
jgi:hypothetical protein